MAILTNRQVLKAFRKAGQKRGLKIKHVLEDTNLLFLRDHSLRRAPYVGPDLTKITGIDADLLNEVLITLGLAETRTESQWWFTNQQVFSALYKAAEDYTDTPKDAVWNTYVIPAKLQDLIQDRSKIYDGVAIEQLNLPRELIEGMIALLGSEPPKTFTNGTQPDVDNDPELEFVGWFTNQQLIQAIYSAVDEAKEVGQLDEKLDTWHGVIVPARLGRLAPRQLRSNKYVGQALENLNLPDFVKQSVIERLEALKPDVVEAELLLDVPWISQIDGNSKSKLDCGPACVLMLLHYHGIELTKTVDNLAYTLNTLRDLKLIDSWQGKDKTTNTKTLAVLAQHHGLILKCDYGGLDHVDKIRVQLDQQKPVILLVNYQRLQLEKHLASTNLNFAHWLVVVGYDGDDFIIHDPLWTPRQRDGKGGANIFIHKDTLQNALHEQWKNGLY